MSGKATVKTNDKPFVVTPPRTADEARVLEHLVLAGWGKDFRTAPVSAREAAADVLERWVRLGLPFSKLPGGSRGFDPAEVLNFGKSAGLAGKDDFWATRYTATGRNLIREFAARPRDLEPRGFQVRLEREFGLGHLQPGTRARLRLPFPADVPTLRDLRVGLLPPETRTQPGYAETFATVPEHRSVVLEAAYEFVAHPTVDAVTELAINEREAYLQQTGRSRVSALAAELAANLQAPLNVLRAFWNFFFERMVLGVLHGEDTLDDVLDLELFDCRLGSALLVALCRARGIPARTCSGFTLYSIPFYHYWVEAWIEGRGWFPVDLTCWDLSLRGADEEWREYFFGALDYRMTVEVLPGTFTGFPSLSFPHEWYALARPLENGAAIGIYASQTGKLVYEDRVLVKVNAGPLFP